MLHTSNNYPASNGKHHTFIYPDVLCHGDVYHEPDDDCLNAEAAAFHARLEAARAAAAGEPGAAAAASSSAAPEADDDDDDDSAEADAERRQLVATAVATGSMNA